MSVTLFLCFFRPSERFVNFYVGIINVSAASAKRQPGARRCDGGNTSEITRLKTNKHKVLVMVIVLHIDVQLSLLDLLVLTLDKKSLTVSLFCVFLYKLMTK